MVHAASPPPSAAPHPTRLRRLLPVAAGALLAIGGGQALFGCGTVASLREWPGSACYVYSGVRYDLAALEGGGSTSPELATSQAAAGIIHLVDLPFSFVLDTALLPGTLVHLAFRPHPLTEEVHDGALTATHVTPDDLDAIAEIEGLRHLVIASSPEIEDAHLATLARLTSLETLALTRTGLQGSGLRALAKLPKLWSVSVTGTGASDAAVEGCAALRQVRHLTFGWGPVTNAGIARLAGLTRLERLELLETAVTAEGVAALRRALPRCNVSVEPSPKD